MAQHRTKKAKQQAHQRRAAALEYQLEHTDQPSLRHADPPSLHHAEGEASELLVYSKQLIKQDLLRTVWATALVFIILVALYFKL